MLLKAVLHQIRNKPKEKKTQDSVNSCTGSFPEEAPRRTQEDSGLGQNDFLRETIEEIDLLIYWEEFTLACIVC